MFSEVAQEPGVRSQRGGSRDLRQQFGDLQERDPHGFDFRAQFLDVFPFVLVVDRCHAVRSRGFPRAETRVPARQQRAYRHVQHRQRELSERDRVRAAPRRHFRAVFAQDLPGGAEQGVEAAQRFPRETFVAAEFDD
ncbi:hypothetical protein [Amycolatopsis sp. M39]|uniref:hypothetical protein n=1 Tax=Amycolatopsis sp. M39 TaxID=1825094 RepID=UPI0012FFA2BA|nr:hypothetical protein [Amycolatopsis sp. M39]